MKRILTALAIATVTATSALAVTTPEDRAFEEAFRANSGHAAGVKSMGQSLGKTQGQAGFAMSDDAMSAKGSISSADTRDVDTRR